MKGACARNMYSDPAEIKPAQCCIRLVFHLTYVFHTLQCCKFVTRFGTTVPSFRSMDPNPPSEVYSHRVIPDICVNQACRVIRNRVSFIIRRYTDRMKFCCFFHILLVLLCIIVYTAVCFACFYLILYIIYSYCYVYVFILLCMFRSTYCVSLCLFCVLFVCKCVLYYCHRVSTQLRLTNISHHITTTRE